MITLALCEDNEFQRELMVDFLREYSLSHTELKISAFSKGRDLLTYIKQNDSFDIYILDIVMPDINGMELASTLRLMKDNGIIIFTTASLEYAVASYDVRAFHYLIKPIDPDKLFRILDNAVAADNSASEVFDIKLKGGDDASLRYQDIMFVEVRDRALRVYLRDGRCCDSVSLRGSFREAVEPLLKTPCFAPCGVSRVINLKFVDAVDSESVLLSDGTQIYPPRSAYADFRKCWKDFTNK